MSKQKNKGSASAKSGKVTNHPLKRGWFKKKGGVKTVLSKARKRWFVMDDDTITYYEKPDEKKCKGNIYIQQVKQVKTSGKELLLVTDYRTYSLTASTGGVEQTIEWADAVELRLKDSETVRKVVKKAEKLIKKSAEVEKHSKELCEYIEMLEIENKTLRDENDNLRKQVESLQAQPK